MQPATMQMVPVMQYPGKKHKKKKKKKKKKEESDSESDTESEYYYVREPGPQSNSKLHVEAGF